MLLHEGVALQDVKLCGASPDDTTCCWNAWMDVSIEDCEQLVRVADKDGNGVCDFDEFKAICRKEI